MPQYCSEISDISTVQVSDDTVKLGTLPVDVIIANLTSLCADEGQCDTGPVSIKGYQLIGTGHDESYSSTEDETVTIAASGSYPTWIHNGLLEVLGAAANSVANCSSVTVKPPLCPEIRGLPGDCPGISLSKPFLMFITANTSFSSTTTQRD